MTLREEVMKSAGVLNEGLFDKLKIKRLTAQREKLIQQAQAEQDPEKRRALNQQAIDLGNQIRKLQTGSVTGELDKKMAPYMAQAQGQPQAAKKHEDCCPQCGKKFSECTCK